MPDCVVFMMIGFGATGATARGAAVTVAEGAAAGAAGDELMTLAPGGAVCPG